MGIINPQDSSSLSSSVVRAELTNAISPHLIMRGFEVVYNTTSTVDIWPGELNHGYTKVSKTTITTLNLATAGHWWDGAVDSYSGGAGWCYIGVDNSGNIRFLGANPPDKDDTDGNANGTRYYWYDTSKYWRIIGVVHISTGDVIDQKFKVYRDGWVYLIDGSTAISGSVGTDYSDFTAITPSIATKIYVQWTAGNGASTYYYFRVKGETNELFIITAPGAANADVMLVPINSSGVYEYKCNNGSYPYGSMTTIAYYIGDIIC